jgi:hypothetical protein
MRFILDKEAEEIYVEVFLNDYLPWYSRVWRALQYVFGYKCKYGHWDCTIIDREGVKKLREIFDEFEKPKERAKFNRLKPPPPPEPPPAREIREDRAVPNPTKKVANHE